MKKLVRESVRRMAGYVPGEQPATPDLIKLNTNENPYPPSPAVLQALRSLPVERLGRYPDPRCADLRRVIARYHGTGPECVFVGNGSDEVLALCTRTFVEDGRRVGYFDPSYSLYPVLAAIRDVPSAPTALSLDFDWREPDVEGCDLFLLANPNAPSGRLYSRERIESLARRFEGVLVVDEAYVDFAGRDCLPLAKERDNVMVVRTLSKSFSLAGLRLGYAVGPPVLIEALFKVKDSYNVNTISQVLAAAALSDPGHMRANVDRIKATRARLAAALTEMGHLAYPSEANFVWCRPEGETAAALFRRLRRKGILVRYFPGQATCHCLRITIGVDRDIDALVSVLREGGR